VYTLDAPNIYGFFCSAFGESNAARQNAAGIELKVVPMYRKIYDPLLGSLEEGLEKAIAEHSSPAERLSASRAYIQFILDQLKELLLDHPFPAQADEIEFFKTIKPSVYAHKIFEEEFYKLNLYQPAGTNEMIIAYLNEELKQVGRFFSLNAFHYQYYKLGATELDSLYFLRGAQLCSIPILELPDPNSDFSTGMDYLFARFIAFERLQSYLIKRITEYAYPGTEIVLEEGRVKAGALKWTGEAINLVEIAYGIWLTGQLNDGNASITEIIQWLEDRHNINIGRPHRRWTEISQRKIISSTKYIDLIKGAINKRIDDENAIKRRHGA
jgi:hypothetical protein